MIKSNQNDNERLIRELDAIKRLLVLALIKAGAQQKEIAIALNTGQNRVSEMFSSRKVKPFKQEA